MMQKACLFQAFLLVAIFCLISCGRSPSFVNASDGGMTSSDSMFNEDGGKPSDDALTDGMWPPGDGWIPRPDYNWPEPDRWPPPYDGFYPDDSRPAFDTWPWPPSDGGPKPDVWPPSDGGPKPDVWPPQDGPCSADCWSMCKFLLNCGLYSPDPSGVDNCAKECFMWPYSQQTCLRNVVCSTKPSCSSAKACLPTPSKPDLVITDLKATVKDRTVIYSITTCNAGKANADAFYVDVYYDRSTPPSINLYGNQYQKVSGLAAGGCTTVTLTRTNTPSGTYLSWAQVDADGHVEESNESNNVNGPIKVLVSDPQPTGPDLIVQSLTATVGGGSIPSVTYRLVVCNTGNQVSPSTDVHLYYHLSSPPPVGKLGDNYSNITSLSPGACVTRSLTRSGVPQGVYNSYAQVDPGNWVKETNEGNNVFGPVQVVVGTSPGADLSIKSFTYSIYNNNSLAYEIRVCNVGNGMAGNTQVHIYWNRSGSPQPGEAGDQYANVPMLAAGACTTQRTYRYGVPAGTYSSWAQVDPLKIIPETNENNNIAGPLVVKIGNPAQPPDLVIKQLAPQIIGNSNVRYTVTICNLGAQSASSLRVDVYYHSFNPPGLYTPGNQSRILDSLSPNTCIDVALNATQMPAGTYSSWAQVDTYNAIAETNENNNIFGPVKFTVAESINCSELCKFATSCGYYVSSQWSQCISWCNGASDDTKQCAQKSWLSQNCNALPQCSVPIAACSDICTYLIKPCNILNSSQYPACTAVCQTLTSEKLLCVEGAQAQGQCNQMLTCFL